jgi:hypothetical protein
MSWLCTIWRLKKFNYLSEAFLERTTLFGAQVFKSTPQSICSNSYRCIYNKKKYFARLRQWITSEIVCP